MYLVWLQGCGTFLLSHSCNFNLQENISKVIWTLFSYSPTWYCQGVPQSGPWYKQYIILLCYSPTWYCHGVPQSGSWYNQYIIPLCYSPTWYCQGVPQSGSWYKQYIIFVYTLSSFSRPFFKRVAWFCSLRFFLSFLNVQNYLHVQFWMYKILFVL